jgi:hypothetical protein
MRLLKLAVLVCLVVLAPVRADAWFGALDYLSGPGPFFGQLYDVRLACFGGRFTLADTIDARLAEAIRASARVRTAEDVQAANDTWGFALAAVESAQKEFPVLPAEELDDLRSRIQRLSLPDYSLFNRIPTAAPAAQQPAPRASDYLTNLVRRVAATSEMFHVANVARNATGVLVSACSPNAIRRYGVDLAVDWWQASSDPQFANDYTIRLITLVPGVSYRVFKDARHDFLDVGIGAGLYWFSSRGFDTFRGVIVQPRLDFHGPSSWVNAGGPAQLAGLLTFRVGLTAFPGGFDADAFNAAGEKRRSIKGSEWAPTAAVYFNLTPFLRRPKHVFPIM